MTGLIIIIVIVIVGFFIWQENKKESKGGWVNPNQDFPTQWRVILVKEVAFYQSLTAEEKKRFEFKVQEFLSNCRITGIETTVSLKDELLVASSAIIPIFEFDDWKYTNIYEVLLYPSSFNQIFETSGPGRNVLGMVGSGYMEGKMILSKEALNHGFRNEKDKKNTAIHEFVHLIDKSDGAVDGIPALLLDKQYAIPWIDLINKKIEEIFANKSDINPYGGTNRQEFFSVVSEYFFERPKLLKQKHPELYELLEKIFRQKMNERNLDKKVNSIGRNSPCPCNSGLKFKKCCGSVHYNN